MSKYGVLAAIETSCIAVAKYIDQGFSHSSFRTYSMEDFWKYFTNYFTKNTLVWSACTFGSNSRDYLDK
jgi:hypothetical protein